jgi:hypothetical protein
MTGAFVEGCCKQIEESAKNFRIFVRAGAKTSFGQAGLRPMISLLSADEPRLAHYFRSTSSLWAKLFSFISQLQQAANEIANVEIGTLLPIVAE